MLATTGVKTKKGRRLGASAFCKTLGASIARNHQNQLRGQDSNLRPRGYEPRELPGCSTPRCVGLIGFGCFESPHERIFKTSPACQLAGDKLSRSSKLSSGKLSGGPLPIDVRQFASSLPDCQGLPIVVGRISETLDSICRELLKRSIQSCTTTPPSCLLRSGRTCLLPPPSTTLRPVPDRCRPLAVRRYCGWWPSR